ncbi:hypothetical protein GQ607_002543 [Colletotrichum asianum]|uniref:Uncharacterized protein n=1 Tax=Colletotrichum asianum TaxID=702518 RepID=A0A8H3WT25_9PEZI|nr:hypothetical protein GQ607_002543 [Colletotrichum asianum]
MAEWTMHCQGRRQLDVLLWSFGWWDSTPNTAGSSETAVWFGHRAHRSGRCVNFRIPKDANYTSEYSRVDLRVWVIFPRTKYQLNGSLAFTAVM